MDARCKFRGAGNEQDGRLTGMSKATVFPSIDVQFNPIRHLLELWNERRAFEIQTVDLRREEQETFVIDMHHADGRLHNPSVAQARPDPDIGTRVQMRLSDRHRSSVDLGILI